MTNVTVIQTSPDPEQVAARARRRTSIGARIGAMGQNRIGALLLLVGTLAAIVWSNVSLASYETFWETHLMVGVGDPQLNFTTHALVNDALMAIFFFTVGPPRALLTWTAVGRLPLAAAVADRGLPGGWFAVR